MFWDVYYYLEDKVRYVVNKFFKTFMLTYLILLVMTYLCIVY